jgi:DNA-binding NarL/FixJ family response regulator
MSNENELGKKWKVFIVENHPVVREQLAALLRREANLEVCGDAPDALTGFSPIHRLAPDLVILDISSKRSQGLDFLKQLRLLYPELRVLALSLYDNQRHIERAFQAGATGYLTKQAAAVNLLSVVQNMLEGRNPVQPQIVPQPVSTLAQCVHDKTS